MWFYQNIRSTDLSQNCLKIRQPDRREVSWKIWLNCGALKLMWVKFSGIIYFRCNTKRTLTKLFKTRLPRMILTDWRISENIIESFSFLLRNSSTTQKYFWFEKKKKRNFQIISNKINNIKWWIWMEINVLFN